MRDIVKKTVIINRAVPGSGKTTITKKIVSTLTKINISSAVHSTDNFFMVDGRYAFEIKKLNGFHRQNLLDFKYSLENEIDVVVCDNINIAPWQTHPYTELARQFSYQIVFITFEPRTLKKHIESQIVTKEKPDAHNVPEQELQRFIQEYYLYNPLLDKRTHINTFIHKNYEWDATSNTRKEKQEITPFFDYDCLIKIFPDDYHTVKGTIGDDCLQWITTLRS